MQISIDDDLFALQEKLHKIAEARRMNAKMREILKKRLLIIESKIFTITAKKNKLESFYHDNPKMWGFSYHEYSKLSQIFWGRTQKTAEDHVLYNKTLKTQFSMSDKRMLFINQNRSPRQQALLIKKENKFPVFFTKQLPILPPIRFKPYSIHDIIRYYIFTKLFGVYFPINSIYPHIVSMAMKSRIKELKSMKDTPKLESIGIDTEELKNYISNVLMNL